MFCFDLSRWGFTVFLNNKIKTEPFSSFLLLVQKHNKKIEKKKGDINCCFCGRRERERCGSDQ